MVDLGEPMAFAPGGIDCDRVGLYCAGSVTASRLALMNATVGAQLADKVNVSATVVQWQQHRGEFFVNYRSLYSTHRICWRGWII
jgi:hypothetical protein